MSVKDSDNESLLQTSRCPHHHLQRNGDQSQVQKLLESIEKDGMDENEGHQLKIPEDLRPFLIKENTVCQTTNKIHKDTSLHPVHLFVNFINVFFFFLIH